MDFLNDIVSRSLWRYKLWCPAAQLHSPCHIIVSTLLESKQRLIATKLSLQSILLTWTSRRFPLRTIQAIRDGTVLGPGWKNIMHTVARTVGNLEHVTLMIVVIGMGRNYKPCIVLPGKGLHYRLIGNDKQTPLDLLPHCYVYQRNVSVVDSKSFYDWAYKFVNETNELRSQHQFMLLIMDSYTAHALYKTLMFLK